MQQGASFNGSAPCFCLRARIMSTEPNWFHGGLRFECLKEKCDRNCCKSHGPNFLANLANPGVSISDDEVARAAVAIAISEAEFRERHVTTVRGIQSLKIVNRACTFFDHDNGLCKLWQTAANAVPSKCRSWYPFSDHTLASEMFWKSAAERCPGIGQGQLISEEQILQRLRETAPAHYPEDPTFHERMKDCDFGFVGADDEAMLLQAD